MTAGLKCAPETGPTAKAIVSNDKPKAKETPTNPIPKSGYPAAKMALPQPPNTSQKVPKNSANNFFIILKRLDFKSMTRKLKKVTQGNQITEKCIFVKNLR